MAFGFTGPAAGFSVTGQGFSVRSLSSQATDQPKSPVVLNPAQPRTQSTSRPESPPSQGTYPNALGMNQREHFS